MVAFGRYAVPVPSGDVFQPVNVYPVRLNPRWDSRALSDRTLDRFHETGGGSVSGEGNGRKRDCDLLGEAVALTVHSDGRCAWSFCM